MLACRRVEAWQYLSADLEEPCWRDRHLVYVLVLALPQVVLYVFGLPLLALLMMFRNRNKLNNHVVKFRCRGCPGDEACGYLSRRDIIIVLSAKPRKPRRAKQTKSVGAADG